MNTSHTVSEAQREKSLFPFTFLTNSRQQRDKRTACSPPQIRHHRSPSTAVLLFSLTLSISPFFESNIYSRQPGILAPTQTYKSIMKRVIFLSQETGMMPGLFCLCLHVCPTKPARIGWIVYAHFYHSATVWHSIQIYKMGHSFFFILTVTRSSLLTIVSW